MCDARVFRIVFSAGGAIGCLCCLLGFSGCQRPGRQASPETSCQWNLGYLGKGIAGYRSVHGELPQVFVGPEGYKHSWRTLVVPYVFPEQSATTYHFDQPWDSQNNREALSRFLDFSVHRCPLDPSPAGHPFFTSYLMLVRPPVKDSATGEMRAAILATDAVLVVESVDCGVQFAEPRDLPWEDLWKDDSPFGKGKLNSLHPRVVKALRADGKVIDIPKDITKEGLRKLLTGTATNREKGRQP
jgi:hypothetical protein